MNFRIILAALLCASLTHADTRRRQEQKTEDELNQVRQELVLY
jgi:hypothetical protein